MKLFIATLLFLSSVFATQAIDLRLSTFVSQNEKNDIDGTISVELVGATQTKTVEFPAKKFSVVQEIKVETDFSEDVEKVYFMWNSETKKSKISIGSFLVQYNINDKKDENKKLVKFETEKQNIEHGEKIALLKVSF